MPLGPKMALPRGHMFYTGLYKEKPEKIFSSKTTRPRALIFGMKHHLVNFPKFDRIISLGPKMARPRGHMFYKGLYKGKHEKIFLSETIRLRAMIFGM